MTGDLRCCGQGNPETCLPPCFRHEAHDDTGTADTGRAGNQKRARKVWLAGREGDVYHLIDAIAAALDAAEQRGAERALRDAATAARGMHAPIDPLECGAWADWLDARADAEVAPPTAQQEQRDA